MLYPIDTETRLVKDLSGFWQFVTDKENAGEKENWYDPSHRIWQKSDKIAVPGSWNEQKN